MPISEPQFNGEQIILLNGPGITLTSSGCLNPGNAVDNDPATYADFYQTDLGQQVIFITDGTTWMVPLDWNNDNNTIEVIGAGGEGTASGTAGGGGAYAKKNNLSLYPGVTISVQIGQTGSSPTDTWFDSTGTVLAKAGQTGGNGGQSSSSVGDIVYSGGNGGLSLNIITGTLGGAGGGGAAGPFGVGANGGNILNTGLPTGGAGGGGADAGYVGTNNNGTTGTNGGNNRLGTGGGIGGGGSGGNGSPGLNAGGGGGGNNDRNGGNGGGGGTGAEWDITHGCGGGGGGGGYGNLDTINGGNGGIYGGGGGSTGTNSFGVPGLGGQGLIVITYTPISATRYLRADWGYNALITRVRLKQEIPSAGLSNTGIDFESALGYIEYGPPAPDVPFTAYIPLPVDANIHELTIDPPVYARGIVVYPDAYASEPTYPEVDLYQLQVYELAAEEATTMTQPTKTIVRVGCQGVTLYPWVASSSYPFNAAQACPIYGIKSVDIPITSKEARLTGGETVHQMGSWEVDREYSVKITGGKMSRQAFNYLLGGNYVVDLADSQGAEVQYLTPGYTDRALYVSAVILGTNGDPTEVFIYPYCKLMGAIGFNLQRDTVTDIDIPLVAIWDTTYLTQNGNTGGIYEDLFVNSATLPIPPFHS
jgi:hypothetical protein